MSVTIYAEPNAGPSADAGSDQYAQVMHDGGPNTSTYTVSISGSSSDPEGDAVSTGWSHADCDGQSIDPYYLGWLGDGWCDDGAYGVNFACETYSWDSNDCEVGCSDGYIADCNDECSLASWVGDAYSDDGTWGEDFNCDAHGKDDGD